MEKFAEHYCADNPDLFKNADTTYVLAYAVIMPKMFETDFIRMNTLDNVEESASPELLELNDSIAKEEIKMKDHSAVVQTSLPVGNTILVEFRSLFPLRTLHMSSFITARSSIIVHSIGKDNTDFRQ